MCLQSAKNSCRMTCSGMEKQYLGRLITCRPRCKSWSRNKYEKRTQLGSFFILVAGPGLAPGSAGYEPTEILLLHPATGHSTTVFSTLQAHICFYAIFCYILWIVGVAQLVERGTHKPKAVGS